jgi:hypothetical protein
MKRRRFNIMFMGILIIPILLIFCNTPFSTNVNCFTDNAGITKQFSKEIKSSVLNWTLTEVVSTESWMGSRYTSVAVDGSENVHLVWQDLTNYDGAGNDADIFYKRWNSTTSTWTAAEVVSTGSTNTSWQPQTAVDFAGNVHIIWYEVWDYSGSGNDDDIFYRRWNATSGTWTSIEVVSIESTENSRWSTIAVDGAGNLHVAWSDGTNLNGSGTDYDIFYKCWNVTTSTWETLEVVSTETTNGAFTPSIASDNAGNLHVAWYDYTNYNSSGTDQDIFSKRRNATTGTWTTTEVVSTESTDTSWFPSIAVDGAGNSLVAWEDYTDYSGAGTDDDIFYKRWNSTTGTWTTTEVVFPESINYSSDVSIAADSIGNVHIVWDDRTNYSDEGTDVDIFYKRWNFANGTWTPIEVVSTESTFTSVNPSIAVDFIGNVHVAWQDFTDYGGAQTDEDVFYKALSGNDNPYVSQPNDFITTALGEETINWTFFDDIGVGQFRVWANDTSGNFYVWQNWAPWTNTSTYNIPINRSAPGVFNYTVVYYDTFGLWGNPDTVIVNITHDMPTSNTPINIVTITLRSETINWTLYDDFGGGQFRVWANDTSGTFYVWQNWTSWTNESTLNVPINHTAPGIYNYTIEYYDAYNLYGIPDTVIITLVLDNIPYSNQPSDITTTSAGTETINWTLFDDFGEGQYRVIANDTDGGFYIWQNWTSWTNESSFNIPINRTAPGIYNYTIEYDDNYNQLGISDSVIVDITDGNPVSNQPLDITTTVNGTETIDWVLTDDFGGGQYRVITNNTGGGFYAWQNWTSWTNESSLNIPINRTAPGIYNYTIEYYDIYNIYGIPDMVLINITDALPYSNQPSNISTSASGLETINWTLFDDFGGGQYRVWANNTIGNFYVWENWTTWMNGSDLNIPINRTAPGIYNYTIEYYDTYSLFGIPDTVLVNITDAIPTSNNPLDIISSSSGAETIEWILSDDFGGGQYRVIANDTVGNFYIWQNWTSWINGSPFNILINRTAPGKFNYTIEFNDNQGLFGIQDTVIIEILDYKPTSNNLKAITTALDGSEVLKWVLSDDFEGGKYRVLLTEGSNTIVWINWTSWASGEILEVPIKRETLGTFNYTIEFYDKYNNYGIANSVNVEVVAPEPEFPLLLVILAVVGIVGGISVFGLVSVRKSRRKLRQKELEIIALNKQKAEITEDDIILSKEQRFCLVHKGVIEGYNFICPECGSYYCVRCVEALKETDNECWSCGTSFDLTKKKPKKEDRFEDIIADRSVKTDDQQKITKKTSSIEPKKAPKG